MSKLKLISNGMATLREEGVVAFLSKSKSYIEYNYTNKYINIVARRYIWSTSDSHTDAYRRWMHFQIRKGSAQNAVGGFDLGIGELQFEFMQNRGLEPTDELLDIGCGSLRGGRFYIDYLDAGNYTGMDINKTVIEKGKKGNIDQSVLEQNEPTFHVNDDLRFQEFDRTFDFLIAQSVFTHLPSEDIEECFEYVPDIMHEDSEFYFTYFEEGNHEGGFEKPTLFAYNKETLTSLAEKDDLQINFIDPEKYPHPRTQRMAVLTLA